VRGGALLKQEGAAAFPTLRAGPLIHALFLTTGGRLRDDGGRAGYRFSGGEKQRLAIARAILKDPRLLILDEATSHLDPETEALVQEALRDVMAGRTSFVIAHRLTTVRQADQILVLDRRRIVERGIHRTLIRGGGL
jgi:ABC-type multidrug transport system fused ATPase/permease subunit